jgi:hypothetical protein
MRFQEEARARRATRRRHAHNRAVGRPYWCDTHRCYKIGTTSLRGIQAFLKQWYYPAYRVPDHRVPAGARGLVRGGTADGLRRGGRVDREIGTWCSLGGEQLPTGAHPFTRMLVGAFRRWNWTPILTQVVVGSEPARIGTALDVLVRDQTDRQLVAVEVKCGMEGYFHKAAGKLSPPLDRHPSCPRAHAFLQLHLTTMLLRSSLGIHVKAEYVVRVGATDVCRYLVPAWVHREAGADLQDRMRTLTSSSSTSSSSSSSGLTRRARRGHA